MTLAVAGLVSLTGCDLGNEESRSVATTPDTTAGAGDPGERYGVRATFAAGSRGVVIASLVKQPSLFGPPRQLMVYGHIKSLTRNGGRFELRFDPAWLLSGVTANRAAVEDKVIPPGEVVPNDNYTRDETHRLLTYLVPATAHVTVITHGGTPGLRSTAITVSELAQIVKGKNPKHRPLFDRGNHLGYWIRVATDTVRSLDQQYHP